jgi:hypothetical protein
VLLNLKNEALSLSEVYETIFSPCYESDFSETNINIMTCTFQRLDLNMINVNITLMFIRHLMEIVF